MMNPRKNVLIALLWISGTVALAQQTKQITIEDIWQKNTFATESVYGVNWTGDGGHYTALVPGENGSLVIQYNAATGEPVDTVESMQNLVPEGGSKPIEIDEAQPSADQKKILFTTEKEPIYRRSYRANYYVYDVSTKKLRKLSGGGKQSYATFSPDGNQVAFVRDNNLFVVNLRDGKERALTTDGKFNSLIHGSADWVYEEEFSFAQAFAWSPDSKKIAYYTFDESGVKEYNMQVWGKLYPVDYRFKYPKAGEANSRIIISVYHLDKNQPVQMDIGTETDVYIPRIQWTQNPDLLSIRRMNRLQNKLDILHADAGTGKSDVVLTEESKAYVDLDFTDDLTYLKNGKQFVHSSERSGYKHLYLYEMNGKLVRQMTNGNWEVSDFLGMDEKASRLYFTSTEASPLERHLYVIDASGKNKKRLTEQKGTHNINISPDFRFYLDYYSSASTPTVVSLHQAPSGKLVKVLENNRELVATLAPYKLSKKEFFQFKTSDNATLNGWMIKPPGFDPQQKYPVLLYVYGGPGSQTVTDSWAGGNEYWFQLLAQKGYIVASVDNRGTGARGAEFRQQTYANLGKLEVQDQMEAAKYVGKQPFIDASRIGIYGWSYGGYMASLAMTLGADYFRAGIAGAPVINWRFYDTIYTERYLKTPQENPEGYDAYSPVNHAEKLKGKYLLIHGTGDDNVHFQNSVTMQTALINAGKQFESFYYPNQSHGVRGPSRIHLYHLMTEFLDKNLKNPTAETNESGAAEGNK